MNVFKNVRFFLTYLSSLGNSLIKHINPKTQKENRKKMIMYVNAYVAVNE